MNHINSIEIKNFKSIRYQKIDDCRRINVFIGYPNVGKSNILEALSIFSIDDTNLNFNSFIRVESSTTLFFNGEINNQIEIRINDKHRFIGKFENDSIAFCEQFERPGTSFEKADTGQIFLDDSNDVSVKRSFNLNSNAKDGLFNYKSSSIGKENELRKIRRYDLYKQVSYSNKNYFELSYPYGENIFNILSTNFTIRKEIEELFVPYNLELLFDTREQKFTILKRTPSGIFTIPYELVADTLQRVIFYKTAILSNKEKVLLFEEPEAHMFPPYVKKFTSDVIFDETNQFFIASHSPYVLSEFIEEAAEDLAVFVVDYDKGETVIKRLTENEIIEVAQYGIDLFFNLESYLDKNVQPHSA